MDDHHRTLTLSSAAIEAALNCLDALGAPDSKEPERYRDWYTAAAQEIRDAMAAHEGSTP